MAKAMKKNPRSLRLGAAEIEAADVLGKPTEHLVARNEKPVRKRARPAVVATVKVDPEIDRRINELFGGDNGDPEAELIELGGNLHVGGGDQDAADGMPPPGLGLTDDQQDGLRDAYWQTRYADVEITAQVHAGTIDLLRAAPASATVGQILAFLEAMP